jgi:hypothetical protein
MNQPSQPGKRIVSKAEYMTGQAHRVTVGVICMGLMGMTAVCGVITLGGVFGFIASLLGHWGHSSDGVGAGMSLIAMGLFGAATALFGGLTSCAMQTVSEIDPGIPLTRANTADLPAPESLVRASQEPQEPQAVLLRAATETQEKHKEQLVRAAGEPE